MNDDGAVASGETGEPDTPRSDEVKELDVAAPNDAEEGGVADSALQRDVDAVIKRHAVYGVASGVIPIPLVDLTAASTVQMRMIAQLAELYGISFSQQVAKSTASSLLASVIPLTGFGAASFSLMRSVRIAGPVLGLATMPALYGAITYALGRTFAWHFSKGGTFDTVDPKAFRARFTGEFSKARKTEDNVVAA